MKKGVLRPLKAFYKYMDKNPVMYSIYGAKGKKKGTKAYDNEVAWNCGWMHCENKKVDDLGELSKWQKEFCFSNDAKPIRKGCVTEIGRLYITAFVYDVLDYHYEMMGWIQRCYYKHKKQGREFPDLGYARVLQRIRQNYGYYFRNQYELKYLIIEKFFKKELEKALPRKPKFMRLIEKYHREKYNKFKGLSRQTLMDCGNFDYEYVQYLREQLNYYRLPHQTPKEFWKERNDNIDYLEKRYFQEKSEYDANVKFTIEEKVNKLLK